MTPPHDVPPELATHPTYADVRYLNHGGMGVVYLARNRILARLEALKVLNASYAADGRVRQRFLREVQIAAQLHHPHVAMVYAAFPLGDTLVMAMEYVPGENLADLVKRTGPLPVQKACAFAYQMAVGLQHSHDRGLVHRDLKPGNVIATEQGKKKLVKIIDFGLAKGGQGRLSGHSLTRPGSNLGTPAFMAPEQARNAAGVDGRADVYSLGATLYFLLAGRPPILGENEYDHAIRLATEDPVPVQALRPDVPTEVAAAVAKLLQKDPAARYLTPAAAAAALLPFARKPAGGGDRSWPAPGRDAAGDLSTFPPSADPTKPEHEGQTPEPDDNPRTVSDMFDLAGRLEEGKGVPRDEWAAVGWYRKAAERGHALSMCFLGMRLEAGRGVAPDVTAAVAWYRKAAELGDDLAMANLGDCLRYGRGVARDEAAAVGWYRRAAAKGSAYAKSLLGYCLQNGIGVPRDAKEAVRLYQDAAEAGNSFAMDKLACALEDGVGGPPDVAAANAWFRKAAELDNKWALQKLIANLKSGRGFPKPDPAEAARWQAKLDALEKEGQR